MQIKIKDLTRAGIIAGLYITLSLIILPLSSGVVQVRISECLTLLCLRYFSAVPGVFIGCLIVNVLTGATYLEAVLGSLITLLSGVLTYFTSKIIKNQGLKIFIGGLFPVVLNAFLIPLIWLILSVDFIYVYPVECLIILAGQAISVYALGIPVYLTVKKIEYDKSN